MRLQLSLRSFLVLCMIAGLGSALVYHVFVSDRHLRGRVTYSGQPIWSSLIVFYSTDGSGRVFKAVTDFNGEFTIRESRGTNHLPPGRYQVTVLARRDLRGSVLPLNVDERLRLPTTSGIVVTVSRWQAQQVVNIELD
jgi:hypothetical protein